MNKHIVVIVGAGILLAACNNTVPRGFVQRDWTRTMRELGIVPIFPAREDVMVGDVYLYGFDPNDISIDDLMEKSWEKLTEDEKRRRLMVGMSSRFARLDLNHEILAEYSSTPSFPPTSADYNAILGNPALAAAEEKVAAAKKNLESHKDEIKKAKDALAKADKAVLDATRANEDAATALTDAETALAAAKEKPVDTSKQDSLVEAARMRKRNADDRVTRANRAVDDAAGRTADEQAAAAKEQTDAKREQEDAGVVQTRAEQDRNALNGRKADFGAEEKAVAAARQAKEDAAKALLAANRDMENKTATLTQVSENETPLIAAAQTELDSANSIKDAIAQAGVKLLYAQPRASDADVFTAVPPASNLETANSRINRLRLVAFPEFATVSVTHGDLSALVPIDAMNLGINLSGSNVKKVSVKIPAAESYALSQEEILDHLFTDDRSPTLEPDQARKFRWAQMSAPRDDGSEEGKYFYARVVTEVFYARAMDISIDASKAFGARVGYQKPSEGGSQSGDQGASAGSQPESGAAMLADIQRRITDSPSLPGGTIQVVSRTETSVGLRRVFDRPVAVGVRSLIIKFRRCDGRVEGVVGADGGPSSTTPASR